MAILFANCSFQNVLVVRMCPNFEISHIRLTKSVWPAFAILISSSIWGEGPISILWRMIDGAKDCSGGTSALVSSLLWPIINKLWIMYIFTVSMYMKNSESIFEEMVDEVQINVKVLKTRFFCKNCENCVLHQNCEIFHGAYIFTLSFFGK